MFILQYNNRLLLFIIIIIIFVTLHLLLAKKNKTFLIKEKMKGHENPKDIQGCNGRRLIIWPKIQIQFCTEVNSIEEWAIINKLLKS